MHAGIALATTFLLLESDLIYEPRALTELLAHPTDDAILLSGPTGAGDEVYVAAKRDGAAHRGCRRIAARSAETAYIAGEFVGISKISRPLVPDHYAAHRRTRPSSDSLYYDYETDCLVAAGSRNESIACPVVADLVWAEIDDPGHICAAPGKRVYPEILRRVNANGRQLARSGVVE